MHNRSNSSGFSTVEVIIVLIVVLLVGGIGWFALHKKDTKNAQSSTTVQTTAKAKELSKQLEDAQSLPAASPTADPNAESNISSAPATDVTYKSKYEGFSFKYPGNWDVKVWSDDDSSSGITLTSPNKAILVSFGSPVVAPQSNCANDAPKLIVRSVKAAGDIGSVRPLYLIEYTLGDLKSVALTDWDGTVPMIGQTDKCTYQPAFQSKHEGAYVWFKISDISDQYRQMSAEDFFALPEVQAAKEIIASGVYK